MKGTSGTLRASAFALAVVALSACSPAEPAQATRLQARLTTTEPLASGAGEVLGRLRFRVRPDGGKVCFRLRVPRSITPLRGVVRGRIPGGSRAQLRLFAGPRGATTTGCRRRGSRLLRGLVRRPQSFRALIRNRGAIKPLRGTLERLVGTFETGGFGPFDDWSVANGRLALTRNLAYQGAWAAAASNSGSGNQYQRAWFDVDWRRGADVWYGMALFIPQIEDWCWWTPARWDNFQTFGARGDVGGLRIKDGRMYVDRGIYSSQDALIGPIHIPEGRWFWTEVHQRLSPISGKALTELYVNGDRVGRSTASNTAGRAIDHIRFGNVAMASECSRRSTIYFDRVSLSGSPLGPLLAQRRAGTQRGTSR